MPNRILKESICTSGSIDDLSWFEEVLFYRLIVNCDDYGRFDGRTAIIKNRLFPLKENLTVKTVSEAIHKLASRGLVALYVFEGKPYLYLPSWNCHQNVRAKRSKYPEPPVTDREQDENAGGCPPAPNACEHMNTNVCRREQENTRASGSEGRNANVPDIQSNPNPNTISESVSESNSINGIREEERTAGATHEPGSSLPADLGEEKKKEAYGIRRNVWLTEKEYEKLVSDFGEFNVSMAIIQMGVWIDKARPEEVPEDHYPMLRKKLRKERIIPDGN